MNNTFEDIKRCLIFKLNKKYKGDESSLIKMLEDFKLHNYNKLYSDCLFNCFIMLIKELKDYKTIDYFINNLLKRL